MGDLTTIQAELVETIVVRHAEVMIYELRVGPDDADLRSFEIRTSSGYRAIFPEAHTECDREPCVKPDCWSSHSPSKCHGLHHIEQIRGLAREVAKTYGSAKTGPASASARRTPPNGWTGKRVPNVSTREWAASEWATTMESVVLA